MQPHRENAGRRLLPHVLDELSGEEPNRVLYEVIASNEGDRLQYKNITARDFANAVNRAAWWLDNALGKRAGFPTIGYTGPQDLRYFVFILAAIKTGYKMLYTSPRNSLEGDIAVVQAADCKIWLVPSLGSNVQRLLDHGIHLETVAAPEFAELFDSKPVPPYPYEKTWETGKKDPAWVLHTSGSTGNPKPVFRFLDSIASIDANNVLPEVNGRGLLLHDFYGTRVYLTFPLFHAAGLANGLLWPLFHGTTVIFGPARPVARDVMKTVIITTRPDAVFTAPSLVEEISKDEEFLSLLGNVNALAYGGGPVSKEAGSRIWKHTKLRLSIGTTETGWLPCVETDDEDWNYIHIHPYSGFEFHDRGRGLYELVAVRKPGFEIWQPIFSTFPDLQIYPMKDLFSRHATKPDLFTYEGRADNVLVLSNGEKVQPHSMELTIGAHPLVDAALVVGQGRFQTAAIIQLAESVHAQEENQREDAINRIWPSIHEANISAPTHAKLHRDFVITASAEKPFLKTSKGTVRRGPTIQLYQEDLDRLYAQAELDIGGSNSSALNFSNEESLRKSLRQAILAIGVAPVHDSDDLFSVGGMDSLQVLAFGRLLAKSPASLLGKSSTAAQSLVYKHPTISLLTQALLRPTQQQYEEGTGTGSASGIGPGHEMLDKYTSSLPALVDGARPNALPLRQRKTIVVLTGSTGSLGSYLLDELITAEKVDEIWCLNRSADAKVRQAQLNSDRGLQSDFNPSRVQFRHAALSEKHLGLDSTDYEFLARNATHVIHTQWKVDFNLALSSFEPHIQGVRNLVDLALDSAARGGHLKILFTSSVGIANNIEPQSDSIPETPIADFSIAGSGYGESKLVAERLLQEAAHRSGVDVTICRVGQIAGPVRQEHAGGMWNRKEWFPSIIDASVFLSLIPQTLGRNEWIDWIPVDSLSSIILELAGISSPAVAQESNARIFHCVNPDRVRWEDAILPGVRTRLESKILAGQALQAVGLEQWLQELKAAAVEATPDDETKVSAFKLLSFLDSLAQGHPRPEFETTQTAKQSPGLRKLPHVGSHWMDTWLRQWGY